ncbi:MAG TPA: tetratricopeptide repeat protein [Micromonosporaceae bacterium]|nr:tetratricopeptide repeat protein [Micromonosporaceae bacterium]
MSERLCLVVHWAHRVRGMFGDGQLHVNLRGYDPGSPLAPAEALARFLRALGVPDADIPPGLEERAERYRSLLSGRRMLIVLDNAATGGQVRPLLPGTGACLVVVTSRNLLSGLAARDGARRLPLGLLDDDQAVDLIRATMADYRSGDTDDDVVELARLCARLPLALRIAAERAAARPHMPLTDLIADLRGESSLWQALSLQDEDEADAVRQVFAWSYRTLPPAAARLFRLLGLHPGPTFALPAATTLAGEPASRVRGLLDLLVGAHLLEQTGPGRYQFHDLLRAYAADQANQHPAEAAAARERVLSWYLHTAACAVAAVQTLEPPPPLDPPPAGVIPLAFTSGPDAIAWYQTEQDNLTTTGTTATAAGLPRIAWQLPAVLDPMHTLRNPADHWLALGLAGLDAARRLGDRHAEARMLTTLGIAYTNNQPRRYDHAASYLTHALALHHETGDRLNEIRITNTLGIMHARVRRLPEAADYYQQARTLAHGFDTRWEAMALGNLAAVRIEEGDLTTAIEHAHHSLRLLRAADTDPRLQIPYLVNLARAHREQGHHDHAAGHLHTAQSLLHLAALGEQAVTHLEHGRLHHAEDRLDEAATAYHQAAACYRTLGDHAREAWVLDAVGELLHHSGQPEQAADLHRRAAAVFADLDRPFDQATALHHLATTLDSLGDREAARRYRAQALELVAPFDDPRAGALRRDLHTALHHPAPTARSSDQPEGA